MKKITVKYLSAELKLAIIRELKKKFGRNVNIEHISVLATISGPVILQKVESETTPGVVYYIKEDSAGRLACSCPGFFHYEKCKHTRQYLKDQGQE